MSMVFGKTTAEELGRNNRVNVQRSGSLSGNIGTAGPQIPFLVVTRPVVNVPQGHGALRGYPSNISVDLGQITGYTVVGWIHLTDIPATDPELAEIEELMKKGIIL